MKTRNGFVSNSSSSSFLIAVKKMEPCAHCGRSDPNFFNIVSALGAADGDTNLDARGVEECLKHYYQYSSESPEQLRSKLTALEASGSEVGIVSISYHDENIDGIFQTLKANGAVTVIESLDN